MSMERQQCCVMFIELFWHTTNESSQAQGQRIGFSNGQHTTHDIAKYNVGMGGVDMSDWKVEKYRCAIKSKKWYFFIFTHCLDVAVVNTSILYNLGNTDDKKRLT